jgi:TPR repeat protein
MLTLRIALSLLLLTPLSAAIVSAADYAKGFEAYSTGDYETALAEWTPLAEQGDARSQFGLGSLYAKGWGVPLDDAQAMRWYELAANQGHAEAQYNIGVMYQNGWGVEQSDAEAFKWTHMAAEGGFAEAHRALGSMYDYGVGAEHDAVQSYRWFETGAALGDPQSGFSRDELKINMTPEEIQSAEELASKWLAEFRTQHPDHIWPEEES